MACSTRRGPNVSEYIANLNAIPSEQDLQAQHEDFEFEDDLSMFTNANFFDFDLGQHADLDISSQAAGYGVEDNGHTASPADVGMKPMEFGDFNFGDFGSFNRPSNPASHLSAINTKTPYPASSSTESPTSELISPSSDRTAIKRKVSNITVDNIEESARLAAEEDKRRRNTAASARFRVKKKQREQALEKSAKEMNDKVAALEAKINQLETENRWLKNLITEKNSGPKKEDLTKAWKRYNGERVKEQMERIEEERKDGVGTSA